MEDKWERKSRKNWKEDICKKICNKEGNKLFWGRLKKLFWGGLKDNIWDKILIQIHEDKKLINTYFRGRTKGAWELHNTFWT